MLDVARGKLVAERGRADLHCLGLIRIGEALVVAVLFCLVVGGEHHGHVGTSLLGQAHSEVMHALVVIEPSLGHDLVGRCCHIIDVGFGHRDAYGDVGRIGLVHVGRQRRDPQGRVLHRGLFVGLAVKGDVGFGSHVTLTLFGIKDADFELVLARWQVGQIDGRVGSVQVAGLDGLIAVQG